MRSIGDALFGRVNGFPKSEVVRRTVPCYKNVLEPEGERLAVCLLIDSGRLYRYPFEDSKGIQSLSIKAGYLKGEMEHLRLREFQPGLCRYVDAGRARQSAS